MYGSAKGATIGFAKTGGITKMRAVEHFQTSHVAPLEHQG